MLLFFLGVTFLLRIFFSIIAISAFSVIIKVSKKTLKYTILGATISTLISVLMMNNGYSTFTYTFVAMVVVCIYSEVIARIIKTPANIILIPSSIPLLPGSYLYYSMSHLVHFNKEKFIFYATKTISVGLGIALGGILVSMIIIFITEIKKNWAKKRF